ncbi:MAG TPA: hypothetical protein VGL71_02910 [Urbifossiella sp.]|jgi:chromosome segregation ATPase
MNDYEDDDAEEFDPLNETDPQIRELREEIRRQAAEIVRLEAAMDQIAAASAEHTIEIARLHSRMDELDIRYRRLSRLIWIRGAMWAFLGTAIGQTIAYFLF